MEPLLPTTVLMKASSATSLLRPAISLRLGFHDVELMRHAPRLALLSSNADYVVNRPTLLPSTWRPSPGI